MIKSTAAVIAFSLLSATSAVAQGLLPSLQPEVAYSAYRSFSDGQMSMEGAYHYQPGKHRTEIKIEGQSMTAIIREDLEVLWSLSPAQGPMRFYMEFSMESEEARNGNALVGTEVVQSRLLVSETVGGYRTDKYEVTVTEPEGGSFSGTVWVTDERIPVRMEMADEGGRLFVMEQTNIEIGAQPDELFEIPAGYAKLDLGGLGAVFGELTRGLQTRNDADQGDEQGEFTREVAGHAAEAAKKGVLRGVGQAVRDTVGRRTRGLLNRSK
jgi:hypothetical protein